MNSDGEITKGRKRRELQRRMKKAGRRPDNREESRLRHVGSPGPEQHALDQPAWVTSTYTNMYLRASNRL